MALHAGVWFADCRPTRTEGAQLAEALLPLASDGVTSACTDGVAMAYGALNVWTGEAAARQPLRTADGLLMTWDGRLDNRDDLTLALEGRVADDQSDAAIALRAFRRWGIDAFRRLIGEWSLVIWDGRQRQLWLARDYMGVRPLFYRVGADAIAWSSDLGELAGRSNLVDAIDERFVADYMALRLSTDVTPYTGISAAPTGACVCLSFEQAEKTLAFWEPASDTVVYRDRRQYEEQLRVLWMEAVGARLRTENVVWAELSGGLDSSSIVCMADALIRAARVRAPGLRLLSHVTLHSAEGDERRFIAEVEARTGVRSEVVGVEASQSLTDPETEWITPYAAHDVALAMTRVVRQRGGRLIMSGRVGDTVMACQPDNSAAVLDDIGRGRFVKAVACARKWSRASRKPLLEIGWKLACTAWGTQLAAAPRVASMDPSAATLALLTPRLASLAAARRPPARRPLHVRRSKRRLAAEILGYSMGARLNVPAHPAEVIYTYPYTHRPLVEFMLAVPGEELSEPGITRSLMRRAFAEIVPAAILSRASKGHYSPSIARSARVRAATVKAEQLECVARGWIDPRRLQDALATLAHGDGHTGAAVQRVMLLEQFLAARHRRGLADIPTRKEVICHDVLDT